MRAYLALIKVDLKLALRNKSVLFFNYLFPLIFFFAFAQFLDDGSGGRVSYIVSMVLVLGILGNGLVRRRHESRAGARGQRPSTLQSCTHISAPHPGRVDGHRLGALPYPRSPWF